MAGRLERAPGAFPGISESVRVEAGPLLLISGMVGIQADGNPPESFDDEIDLVFVALRSALERAGAGVEDIAKLTVFIVGLNDERLAAYRRVRDRHLDAAAVPASSLVGVASLFSPRVRIEIEAIAAV
jgi:2-iminobutanoate/2-iminopropanoate deaminase